MLRTTQNQNVCLTNTVNITVSSVARLSRRGLGSLAQLPYQGKRPAKPTLRPAEAEAGRKPAPATVQEAQADQHCLPSSDARWSDLSLSRDWSVRVVNRDMMTLFMPAAHHRATHHGIARHQART